jgi:hypothetical protein
MEEVLVTKKQDTVYLWQTPQNFLVSIDDESFSLPVPVWQAWETRLHATLSAFHQAAGTTEPFYQYRASGALRVTLFKGRVRREVVQNLYALVQTTMQDAGLPEGKTTGVHITDFDKSRIVTTDSSEPWETFIQQ